MLHVFILFVRFQVFFPGKMVCRKAQIRTEMRKYAKSAFMQYALGPAKSYILIGTLRTYAIKAPGCDRQLDK